MWGGLLPLVATVAAIVTILEPRVWLSPSSAWRGLAPVALLYSTALLIVAAPLAGVGVAQRERHRSPIPAAGSWAHRIVLNLLVGALAFACSAAAWTTILSAASGEGLSVPLLNAHVVQAAVALAVALGSAVVARWCRDPLDAAGLSVTLAAVGSFGVLGMGTLAERLPRPLVEWALAGSPLVAVSSAGHIDLMRTDTVYQISPLAHTQLQIPDWPTVAAAYLLAAMACAIILVGLPIRTFSAPPQHPL